MRKQLLNKEHGTTTIVEHSLKLFALDHIRVNSSVYHGGCCRGVTWVRLLAHQILHFCHFLLWKRLLPSTWENQPENTYKVRGGREQQNYKFKKSKNQNNM